MACFRDHNSRMAAAVRSRWPPRTGWLELKAGGPGQMAVLVVNYVEPDERELIAVTPVARAKLEKESKGGWDFGGGSNGEQEDLMIGLYCVNCVKKESGLPLHN